MERHDVLRTVSLLVEAQPADCDRDGLASLVRNVQRVRAWLDAFDNRIGARADELARKGRVRVV